ncbi:hypothetical protein ACMFMF_011591 [Clarireedia jacksonii]
MKKIQHFNDHIQVRACPSHDPGDVLEDVQGKIVVARYLRVHGFHHTTIATQLLVPFRKKYLHRLEDVVSLMSCPREMITTRQMVVMHIRRQYPQSDAFPMHLPRSAFADASSRLP